MKNPCGKMVKAPYEKNAYEIWQNVVPHLDCPAGSWTWYVLKKWQVDDNKPYARWFCLVKTPMMPEGEMGDVYVSEIKAAARRIDAGKNVENPAQHDSFAANMAKAAKKHEDLKKHKFDLPELL